MTKRIGLVAALLGIVSVGTAYAGRRATSPVSVSTSSKFATGFLGTARNAAGTVAYIGCANDSDSNGTCYAITESGVGAACVTQSSTMLATIRSITPNSRVTFKWDDSGNCTYVGVTNYSSNEVIQP